MMKAVPHCLIAAAALIGCSGSEGPQAPLTSTVQGALDASTFPGHPRSVAALDEGGKAVRATLDARSAFTLRLANGHTYRLVVSGDGLKSLPLVFPRSSGQLDTTFRISGGGALVQLGTVRYLSAAAPGETGDDVGDVSCGSGEDNGADGECENGVDEKTGAACTDPPDETDPGASDGECENGVDQAGAACTDPPDETDGETADPNEPMAVADHNAPDDVAGCEEEGDEEEND